MKFNNSMILISSHQFQPRKASKSPLFLATAYVAVFVLFSGLNEPSATIRGVNHSIPDSYPEHSLNSTKVSKKIRLLTTSERAQIQTFPKDFDFIGKKTAVEQIIGNAVLLNLAKYVADYLREYLNNRKNNQEIKISLL